MNPTRSSTMLGSDADDCGCIGGRFCTLVSSQLSSFAVPASPVTSFACTTLSTVEVDRSYNGDYFCASSPATSSCSMVVLYDLGHDQCPAQPPPAADQSVLMGCTSTSSSSSLRSPSMRSLMTCVRTQVESGALAYHSLDGGVFHRRVDPKATESRVSRPGSVNPNNIPGASSRWARQSLWR